MDKLIKQSFDETATELEEQPPLPSINKQPTPEHQLFNCTNHSWNKVRGARSLYGQAVKRFCDKCGVLQRRVSFSKWESFDNVYRR